MSKIEGLPESKLVKSQTKKKIYHNKDGSLLRVNLRYDDQCGNKHNTFAITGDWIESGKNLREPDMCGCIHEEIEKYAPDLAKYIKWHLCTADGPDGYNGNATYFAGNRDCWGRAPGDVETMGYGIRFNGSQVTHFINQKLYNFIVGMIKDGSKAFEVKEMPYDGKDNYNFSPKYSLNDFNDSWYGSPFDNITEATEFCNGLNTEEFEFVKVPMKFSEGKEREFDAARRAAIWPEATAEQLCLPKDELTKLLEDRLPALMEEFKEAMEEIGFEY